MMGFWTGHAWAFSWRGRAAIWSLLALFGSMLATACIPDRTAGVSGINAPPFLAIVSFVDGPPGASGGNFYQYRLQAVVNGKTIDTTITRAPSDTVIIPVKPAEWSVSIAGVPATCFSRRGGTQSVVINDSTNTGIIRFFIICQPLVALQVTTEGALPDSAYVYRLRGAGVDRLGTVGGNDTVLVENIPAGRYDLDIENVAPNCAVFSPGGPRQQVTVPEGGGLAVSIRVTCGDPAISPRLLRHAATYDTAGNVGLVFTVTDPDADYALYSWYLTDCNGRAVPNGPVYTRTRLEATRLRGQDTTAGIALFPTQLDPIYFAGKCSAFRVGDLQGGTTAISEVPLKPTVTGNAPIATSFNAIVSGQRFLSVALGTFHPSDDDQGVFPTLDLRDGTIFLPDGKVDIGIYSAVGYLRAQEIPTITVGDGTRFPISSINAVVVYLFDTQGNFRAVRDRFLNE